MAVTPSQIHAASVPVPTGSGGLPQFDLAQWPGEAVWMLVIFAVMLFLFSKVFVPRVGGTIAAREDRIAGDIGDARRLKAQADAEAAAAAAETAQARARAQKLALFLPTGLTMNALHKLVNFGAAPSAVIPHIVALAGAAGIVLFVVSRRFRFE